MVSIFIGLSQHHVDLFQDHLITRSEFEGDGILITGATTIYDAEVWHTVIPLKGSLTNRSESMVERIKNMTHKIRQYKKASKELKTYKDNRAINLIFSSLEDVLTNYLFFYFSKEIRGYVIEDGVLNYYNHTQKNVAFTTLLSKKILSIAHGLNFKIYSGHTSGIEYAQVVRQYVRVPSLTMNPKKSTLLPVTKRSLIRCNKDILILGQEPYANVAPIKYAEKLDQLLFKIKSSDAYKKADKIIYKPHRHGPRHDYSFFAEKFMGKEVEYVSTEINAEDYFFERARCQNLVTFDSSAVFNIYIKSDSKTQEKLNITVFPFEENELTGLFKNLGFNFY